MAIATRVLAFLAFVGVGLASGCSGGSDSSGGRYSDPRIGWTVTVPVGFHSAFVDRCEHGCVAGSLFANFPFDGDPLARLQQPPDNAIALWIGARSGDFAARREVQFPLKLTDLRPSVRHNAAVVELELPFTANGWSLRARAFIGRDAGEQDRAALERLVASLRFPPLKEGTVVANSSYVLGRPKDYPVGSVTRYGKRDLPSNRWISRQTFFLVHAPGGFYAIGHTANRVGGFPACLLQFDRSRSQFFCSNGARWDRVGRVVVNPNPDRLRDDPLQVFQTRVSQDDHVLVSTSSYRSATAEVARQLWPNE